MIHALLVIAAILFVLWLLFHAAGAVIHLLWILIVAAIVIWLVRMFFRGGRSLFGR
jgi:multisubunit Na+/H+ antiporter MnhE subunit